MVTQCPKCEGGMMFPKEVHVHVMDNMMIRGNVRQCAKCGEVGILTEVYQHVTAIKKRATKAVAKIGL